LGRITRRAKKYLAENDYVFKRYRLEENRHFSTYLCSLEDKNGEEFTYENST
jgi:hypothetical protein